MNLRAIAGAVLLSAACRSSARQPPAPVAAAAAPPPQASADWCVDGYEPISGEGCFALALPDAGRLGLIVYLHGRYARDAAAAEIDRQRRLAQRATSRGFSVLAFRGDLGACTAPELADWYCWPSNSRNADAAPRFVERFGSSLAAARERTGEAPPYLLGFSNGGYFAGLIAARALLETRAVVVAHGGSVPPVHGVGKKPPLLLLSADDDVAQDDMMDFDEALAKDEWAHDSYARGGAHGLGDEDIDAALAFFARAAAPLPLSPPLALHRPQRRVRDSGAPSVDPAAAPTSEPVPPDPETAPAESASSPSP